MSALVPDLIIFILLVLSVGFCGISVIGLLLFPDIRSRSYTAMRSSLIGCGSMAAAGTLLSLFLFFTRGGSQYLFLFALIGVLVLVIILGNIGISRIILHRTLPRDHSPVTDMDTLKK
ncbi:MAG: hypothetical protein METHP_02105 [Methanoregula sp. SKADARSKE-2]|nr:MAG: hypothetical protein METHP_02105 [Methanoregula sp. SKADARSKE-2]